MAKTHLQASIIENEGLTLSYGTLNLNDLLAAAYDLIINFELLGNPNKHIQTATIRNDIREVFQLCDNLSWSFLDKANGLAREVYFSNAEIPRDKEGEAHRVWDDVDNYFNSLAPDGYFFGSTEADGSDIGWHKNEEGFIDTEAELEMV